AFVRSAFQTPHLAVYNSAMLRAYFETRSGLVGPDSPSASATLENALKRPTKAQLDRIAPKSDTARRRLVFYARPEGHAARNMFATFVLGLKRALNRGVFDGHPWEFIGLGSLAFQGDVPLGDRHVLDVRAKLPKAEYEDFLLTGDIGASFISTPHPGIIHFQMAAFGLPTLTNKTELRTEDWFKEQNGNLISVDLTAEAIAEGLALAVDRAEDVSARKANALAGAAPKTDTAMAAAVEFVANEVRRPTASKTTGRGPK
ncbi:MAG: hypothetical protein QNJ35_16370, partial [Paracoccaceae bacterium]|nr:hypothetical protein [Paracoccaceae bacterium]